MDFQKKEWQFRDIISENELNRMEDGIEEGITKAEQAQDTADNAQNAIDNHTASTSAHGATSAATPNRIVMRDSWGSFKATAPSEPDDVARKVEVDIVQENLNLHANATTSAHGATSEATPNRIVMRDENGRAKFAAPAATDDVARKAEVDAVQADVNSAQRVKITQDNGGPKLSISDPSKDFLAELIALGQGMHTFYVIGGAVNAPPRSTRGHAFFTGTGAPFGYVLGVDYQNVTWINYHDGANGWRGWRNLATSDQEAWIAPTLLNGWVNYEGGFATAGYYKDNFGTVHLKGRIKDGAVVADTVLFTLPAAYRPSEILKFIVPTWGGMCEINVSPSGNVTLISGGDTRSINLDGIIFRAGG